MSDHILHAGERHVFMFHGVAPRVGDNLFWMTLADSAVTLEARYKNPTKQTDKQTKKGCITMS